MTTLTQLVCADHRYTERLLAQLTADPSEVTYDDTARENLAGYLVVAESRHEAAEELVLWPAVRTRVPGGRELIAEGLRQEREAKYVLDTLRTADGPSRQRLGSELVALSRAHIAFEETEVLPALERVTVWPGMHLLGTRYRLAKRMSPTRPHPHGPDGHLGLLTKGLAVAAVDRLRDRMTGRAT